MKKVIRSLIATALCVCSLIPLAACNANGDMLSGQPNVGIEQGVSESVGEY